MSPEPQYLESLFRLLVAHLAADVAQRARAGAVPALPARLPARVRRDRAGGARCLLRAARRRRVALGRRRALGGARQVGGARIGALLAG